MKDFSAKRGRNSNGTPGRKSDFDQKVLDIARVSRVTKGGKRFSFRAAVVIGDGKGSVGLGVAQGKDVAQSIQKAAHQGKRDMVKVVVKNHTISHLIMAKFNSAIVLLKPASLGNGVKAGGSVRAIVKLAGIDNITGKLLSRTNNKINIAKATLKALEQLKSV